ncbi:MAG: signal peptidase I [Bacteroidota bacterium]
MKNRSTIIATLLAILFLVLMGLLWLSAGLLLLLGLYYVFSCYKLAQWMQQYPFFAGTILLIGIFGLVIVVRIFVLEIHRTPSTSMEDTLVTGDKVMMSKLNYSLQLPRSPFEIPWVNLLFFITKEAKSNPRYPRWNCSQLEGLLEVLRGDIIVFEPLVRSHQSYVKRCVGLSGEVFQIKVDEVPQDQQVYSSPATAKQLYEIDYNHSEAVNHLLNSLHLPYHYRAPIENPDSVPEIPLTLNERQKKAVQTYCKVDRITRKVPSPDRLTNPFPGDSRFQWIMDNFGLLHIPASGITISLTPNKVALHGIILKKYETVTITERDGKYYAKEKKAHYHIFFQNHYFMMGDNSINFRDLVPEGNVLGKIVSILYFTHDNDFKWDRLFNFSLYDH